MIIKSYLAFPRKGEKDKLAKELRLLDWCEVTPAENKELLVVVAETADKDDDEAFQQAVNQLQSLDHLTLVAGFDKVDK